jgi:hypothetical protein
MRQIPPPDGADLSVGGTVEERTIVRYVAVCSDEGHGQIGGEQDTREEAFAILRRHRLFVHDVTPEEWRP